MRFDRTHQAREFDIVSLVDMVLLLLTFGLVASAIIMGGGQVPSDEKGGGNLNIKVFRIVPDIPQSTIVFGSSASGTIDSATFAPDLVLSVIEDEKWESQPAVRLLQNKIKAFYESGGGVTDSVLVEVDPRTIFRIVGAIMSECGLYGGDSTIPAVRVAVTGKEGS